MEAYKKYIQSTDNRTMDAICAPAGGWQLQVQQEFLKQYVADHNATWKRLLLHHLVGSGKTCTAITIAEKYKELNPNCRVVVILPARLKTNFIDELVSPCGLEKYLSAENFATYSSSSTTQSAKKKIKAVFTKAINEHYTILSFEKWRQDIAKSCKDVGSLTSYMKEFTKNTLIIVDEVHNLLSSSYNHKKGAEMESTHRYISVKGGGTLLLKYMSRHAHASPTSKMLFLTATPIFDNIGQFKELVELLDPKGKTITNKASISEVIDRLKDKVSYFPGISPNAYPSVSYVYENIPMSKLQEGQTLSIQLENTDEVDDSSEQFMTKQRQISLCAITKKPVDTWTAEDLVQFAPKMKRLVHEIEKNKGKHLVYCSFVAKGLRIVQALLEQNGWINASKLKKDEALDDKYTGKVYALWDGSTKDNEKQWIKVLVNSKENMNGDKIRVILGSPSMKEGVSFKHIRHMHVLDPLWNISAQQQVEGRAIRFCSHIDLPKTKRLVHVHLYKCIKRKDTTLDYACDEMIYDEIIPKKTQLIRAGESALKHVALDRTLFRKLYVDNFDPAVMNETIIFKSGKEKNSCPKKRRPLQEQHCPPGMYAKLNPKGDMCCYKSKPEKVKKEKAANATCPKPRRPDPTTGKCSNPAYPTLKKNKHDDDCCYRRG